MIRFVESIGHMQIWDVDGVRFMNRIKLSVTVDQFLEDIQNLKRFLEDEQYVHDSKIIRQIYSHFGFMPLFRLGFEAFEGDFLKMCRWYCGQYFISWYEEPESEALAAPSIARAIAVMLGGCAKDYSRKLREQNIRSAGYDDILRELMHEEFELFCRAKVVEALESGNGLKYIRSKIGLAHLTALCADEAPEMTRNYLSEVVKGFTRRRETITKSALSNELFGNDYYPYFSGADCDSRFHELFCKVITGEEKVQSKKFTQENYLEMDVRMDMWKLFSLRGGGIMTTHVNFAQINSPSLRTEVKHYMKFYLSPMTDRAVYPVGYIAHALNCLTSRNPNIKYAADISEADVKALFVFMETEYISPSGKKLNTVTINMVFSCCSTFFEYLMGDQRSSDIKSPRPHRNPFKDVSFVNISSYGKRTEVIPESIMEKLDAHIDELPEQYALLYKIFSNTGMRAKEAFFLEADCIEPSMHEDLFQIRYTPYKVLAARRKAGLDDFHRVLIHAKLADEIRAWAKETEKLRQRTGQPYLFLSLHPGSEGRMLGVTRFTRAVNGLLSRHSIGEDDGTPWHFTSRQCRKTVAVTLIENGATAAELAYVLGHLNSGTSMKYYAEVRKMKLAELNTGFFKKQFELRIPAEQLERFNEEERKLLYIDFRLDKRRVELGFCLQGPEIGGCDRRSNLYGCVNCRHLCTGRQYLKYWQELLAEQERRLAELERVYERTGVTQYGDFREYQQTRHLCDGYKSVVSSISESGCK